MRGAGANTQILLGSYNNTNVLLFTTTDGVNFTPTLITVTNAGVPLGFAGAGIAFGFGNTFWAKGGHNYNLRQVAFDLATKPGIGSVVQLYAAGTQVPNDLTGLGVDVPNNVLAGVCFNNTPGDLQLYLLSTNPPALFDQAFFASNNLNSQQNAVTTLRNGLAFGLNVNNGVVALGYQVPPSLPPVATTILSVKHQAASGLTLTWQSVPGRTYQVQSKTALTSGSWSNVGPVLGTLGPTTSYTDTTAVEAERFYRICVQ